MALTKVSSGLISADASSVDLNIDAGTLYLDATNNRVGIGTSSPNTKLDISGNVALNAATVNPWRSSQTVIQLNEVSTLSNYGSLVTVLDHNSYIDSGGDRRYIETGQEAYSLSLNSYDNGLIFSTASAGTAGDIVSLTEKFRITTGGNVGIGTDSPAQKLHISSTGNTFARIDGGATSTTGVTFDNGDGAVYYDANSNFMRLDTNGAERMRIDSSGSVGIGTSSPSVKLDVSYTSGQARFGSASGNNLLQVNSAQSMGMWAGGESRFYSTGNFKFAVNATVGTSVPSGYTDAMTIDSSGNVGIGTTSPQEILHASSGSNPAFHLTNTDGTNGGTIRIVAATNGAFIGLKSPSGTFDALRFGTGNEVERMRIDSSGRLLINGSSANAQGMLQVFFNDAASAPANYGASFEATRTNSSVHIAFENPNGVVGSIQTLNSATSYNTSSDGRLKNILGKAKGLEVINKLNPVNFEWKKDKDIQDGLIAQEVKDIVPNAVSEDSDGYYQMDYSKLVTPLIKAVQEQQEQIESLKSRIEILEANNG